MGKQRKQCQTLFFWAPKSLQMVTAAMKLKDAYSLEEKAVTNLDYILKSRGITLPTKVRLVKAMVFPVVMYGYESWTIKKAERRRIDVFEPWYWRRLLRVPWTARRSNQSILKEISPGCSLEGLMLKLKLQYFGHLMRRTDLLEKTLMLGKTEGRRRGQQRMRCWISSPTWWTWVWVNSGSWWWTGRSGMLWFMGSQRVGHDWATELNWTELNIMLNARLDKSQTGIKTARKNINNFRYADDTTLMAESESVQFSCSVMSHSFRPHESQHARPPCPSPTPRVHSDSRPSSQWCHPAISSSVVPVSSCPQSLPASESFPMSQLFAWGGNTSF